MSQSNIHNKPVITLMSLNLGGHYPSYIKHLTSYWVKYQLPGILNIVVFPEFLEQYALLKDSNVENETNNIKFVTISPEEASSLITQKSIINRALYRFQEWNLFVKYACLLNSTHALIMILDHFRLPLALSLKSPCPISGIYFRPSFHYEDLNSHVLSRKERLEQWREKFLLSRTLRHPQLKNLFCLDPFAVESINQMPGEAKAVYLPDPVSIVDNCADDLDTNKKTLGINSERKVFLLLGTLNSRRGVFQLLEAIALLPSALCKKLCLVLVGQAKSTEQDQIESQIAKLLQSKPVQIIRYYEFVSEQKVHAYYRLADVVLAIHQKHVGMSGSLVLAAAAQKPVLSSDYGLMGQIVQHHKLGLAVDSTKPEEIVKGLTKFLQESPEDYGDRHKMKSFAEQNSPESFTKTIFQHLELLHKSECL